MYFYKVAHNVFLLKFKYRQDLMWWIVFYSSYYKFVLSYHIFFLHHLCQEFITCISFSKKDILLLPIFLLHICLLYYFYYNFNEIMIEIHNYLCLKCKIWSVSVYVYIWETSAKFKITISLISTSLLIVFCYPFFPLPPSHTSAVLVSVNTDSMYFPEFLINKNVCTSFWPGFFHIEYILRFILFLLLSIVHSFFLLNTVSSHVCTTVYSLNLCSYS